MAASTKLKIAALSVLGCLFVLGFLFLFLRSSGDTPLELTDIDPAAVATIGTIGTMETVETTETVAAPARPGYATAASAAANNRPEAAAEPLLRVYISGAVKNPDVYTLQPGDRLVDAVQAAGGATAEANLNAVNLAIRVQDEGYYYLPLKKTLPVPAAQLSAEPPPAVAAITANLITGELPKTKAESAADSDSNPDSNPASNTLEDGQININIASGQQLETLPGIGTVRAQAIIAYREQHGPFHAIEEVTDVSGIGPGLYDNMQHLITVGNSP